MLAKDTDIFTTIGKVAWLTSACHQSFLKCDIVLEKFVVERGFCRTRYLYYGSYYNQDISFIWIRNILQTDNDTFLFSPGHDSVDKWRIDIIVEQSKLPANWDVIDTKWREAFA